MSSMTASVHMSLCVCTCHVEQCCCLYNPDPGGNLTDIPLSVFGVLGTEVTMGELLKIWKLDETVYFE